MPGPGSLNCLAVKIERASRRRIHEVRIGRPRATDRQANAEPAAEAQGIAEAEDKASARE